MQLEHDEGQECCSLPNTFQSLVQLLQHLFLFHQMSLTDNVFPYQNHLLLLHFHMMRQYRLHTYSRSDPALDISKEILV